MTRKQQKAFHLWIKLLSDEFNEIGFSTTIDLTNFFFELRFSPSLFKEQIIKPLIYQIWEKESTKELDTLHVNEIIDIFNIKFAEMGREVEFPSFEKMLNEFEKEGLLK
jgi:hypothetical protein